MEDKTAVDVLKGARELIAREGGWTQGIYARDAHGRTVSDLSTEATCFCIMGAVYRVTNSVADGFDDALDLLRRAVAPRGIVSWNDDDERTQAEVGALFDAAISRASR